jgi:hypothetical protein
MPGVGSIISTTDYNNIRDKVNLVLGTNSNGYGQPLSSSAATSGSLISVSLWNNLRTDLLVARQHQSGVTESLTIPTTSTLITESFRAAYDSMADTITANKFICAPNKAGIEPLVNRNAVSWYTQITHTVTVSFLNNTEARYFFNAGGQIRFNAYNTGTTGGSSGAKNVAWQAMIGSQNITYTGNIPNVSSGMGVVAMNYNSTSTVSGSASTPGTGSGFGFYTITGTSAGSANTLFTTNGPAGLYAAVDYSIKAYVDNASTPSAITFIIQMNDDRSENIDEVVGQTYSVVQSFRPQGAGDVTVTGPSVSDSFTSS